MAGVFGVVPSDPVDASCIQNGHELVGDNVPFGMTLRADARVPLTG